MNPIVYVGGFSAADPCLMFTMVLHTISHTIFKGSGRRCAKGVGTYGEHFPYIRVLRYYFVGKVNYIKGMTPN